ncbi:E3 ubiquitin-protein ligase RNF13 [Bombina bombina]|uniref:E3 ubiquitin-protein ligase RNF13 n=1 Tax=Bombina bombina TaxID=8345 RepID=UPI00235AC87C|nr:E3 ubiquitin-protein ligase RNF13 [Bombina bombina]XP_053566006.1 E3 ubiquitin-protein ligase RNF13 [Bombina bombina]XP_053566007.1 E3 ubiquitin-protein ligase RNF13 [Bombina bombina]
MVPLKMPILSMKHLCSVLTIHIFTFMYFMPVEADIIANSSDNVSRTFDDLPASFGYRLPSDGLKGFLVTSKPENACEPISPPPMIVDNTSSVYIVLIRRMDCTFDLKVLNAQKAGYKAAIIYNVDSDDLILMASNDFDIKKKIDIPSVFIGESSAHALKEEFTWDKGGHVVLIPELNLPLEYYLLPFLIIVGICLVLIVIFMITKCVQDRHRERRYRLRKDQLKKLPIHKYKKGDEYDVCAVCLDEYEEGDKLRILPCSHAYHSKCVDPWLTKTKKTCPVCKQKVVPSQGDSDSDSDSSQEENEISENTPLIRPMASVSSQSFGAISESHTMQNAIDSSDEDEDEEDDEEDDDDEADDCDSSEEEEQQNTESVVVQLQHNMEREPRERNTV